MVEDQDFRHLGGGRKGILLLLRYVYILAASYLVLFESATALVPTHGVMIACALTSNVILSFVPARLMFAWFVEAPILIADTLWVAWALHSTGASGPELFLLYFFVLFLAVVGESVALVVFGSTLVSATEIYVTSTKPILTSNNLLRITFFYTVALFFGYVITQIQRERRRADKGFAWAKALEAKVAERTAELSRLYEESQTVSRLKSEFLATVSHELRTPLHIIVGYGTMMKDKDSGISREEREWMLDRLIQAANEQIRLVTNVLDLGRIESGRMPVDKQPVRLDRFLADFKSRQRMTPANGVRLNWAFSTHPLVVETDPEKLTVILDNLISNAIKFTAAGSIDIGMEPKADYVEFSVQDTGPGIHAADLPTIFEMFRQVGGTDQARGGVGLGLAIVARYARLLGGNVAVQSKVGCGSRFTVTLPLPQTASNATLTSGLDGDPRPAVESGSSIGQTSSTSQVG